MSDAVTVPSPAGRVLGPQVAVAVLLGAGLVDVLMERVTYDEASLVSWWSSVGLVVGLLAVSPRSRWPALLAGVLVVTVAARLVNGHALDVSLPIATAHVLQAWLGAWIMVGRRGGPPTLTAQRELLRLILAALAVSLTGALLEGVPGLLLLDELPDDFVWAILASHAASVAVLAPLAVVLNRPGWPEHWPELPVQVGALVASTWVTFGLEHGLPLTFLPLCALIWAALRMDIRVVALQLVAFHAWVTVLSASGLGAFNHVLDGHELSAAITSAMTQAYGVCVAVIVLPLSVAVHQQRRLVDRVVADEEQFRRNFSESLMGMAFLREVGGDLVVEEVNMAAARIFAAAPDDLSGRPLTRLVRTGDDVPLRVDGLLEDGTAWHGPVSVRARPGSQVVLALSPLRNQQGEPVFSAQLLDVTDEFETRRRLEETQKLTEATLDTAGCIILVTDPGGIIVRANAATLAITGHPPEELVGSEVWSAPIAPLTRAETEALFGSSDDLDVTPAHESVVRSRSGSPLRLVWTTNLVRDEDGRPAYAVMTGVDVTAERASTALVSHLLQASMTTALVGMDPAGRITVFNSGAEHLLARQRDAMVGRPFVELFDGEQLDEVLGTRDPETAFGRLVAEIGGTGESAPRDWVWRTGSDRRLEVSITLSVTQDATSEWLSYLCVARDVTDQREGQRTLARALEQQRAALERLRELDRAKDEFVSTVSHELRTPVTSIVGYTEMLKDGANVPPDPEQLPLLDVIARNGQRLIDICDDLLTLSGIDAGAVSWVMRPLDLSVVLDAARDSVRAQLAARDLTVELESPDGPVPVVGDRAQLERVAVNLLSNAVKFTDDGGSVRVHVAADGDRALLRVSDTGIGIDHSEQQRVFDRFFRSASTRRRAVSGTGLGLSIVAAIVDAHEGMIELDSAPGRGTTFTVTLPLAERQSRNGGPVRRSALG